MGLRRERRQDNWKEAFHLKIDCVARYPGSVARLAPLAPPLMDAPDGLPSAVAPAQWADRPPPPSMDELERSVAHLSMLLRGRNPAHQAVSPAYALPDPPAERYTPAWHPRLAAYKDWEACLHYRLYWLQGALDQYRDMDRWAWRTGYPHPATTARLPPG